MSTPEGRVKDYVRKQMTQLYPLSYRFMPVQQGLGAAALDFYYCVDGHWIAIETKRPVGHDITWEDATPRQRATMKDIVAAGGSCWIVDGPESFTRAHDEWFLKYIGCG